MFPSTPCRICSETDHTVGKCPELWENKTPPPQKGQHGDDDHLYFTETKSGNFTEQDVNQTSGSKAGHVNFL